MLKRRNGETNKIIETDQRTFEENKLEIGFMPISIFFIDYILYRWQKYSYKSKEEEIWTRKQLLKE